MRELKFRAWDSTAKKMLHFDNLSFRNEYSVLEFKCVESGGICGLSDPDGWGDDFYKGGEKIVMQFTGLKDKNGKEIYEGDILKFKHHIGEVWWQDRAGYWAVDFKPYPEHWQGRETEPKLSYSGEFEIIGNIYENPSLLKDTQA